MSLICRPTAGCLDLVQRVFEGLVNTPDAIFDRCQMDDFRNRQAAVGTDLWWERVADPDGAAVRPIRRSKKPLVALTSVVCLWGQAMGLGVQGAATNVSSSNRNVNAQTGPLATNTLAGMAENLNDGVDDFAVSEHFRQQVAEARAAAIGQELAKTVVNPAAASAAIRAPSLEAPQMAAPQQVANLPTMSVAALGAATFCAGCGAKQLSGAKFCPACGTPCGAAAAADMV